MAEVLLAATAPMVPTFERESGAAEQSSDCPRVGEVEVPGSEKSDIPGQATSANRVLKLLDACCAAGRGHHERRDHCWRCGGLSEESSIKVEDRSDARVVEADVERDRSGVGVAADGDPMLIDRTNQASEWRAGDHVERRCDLRGSARHHAIRSASCPPFRGQVRLDRHDDVAVTGEMFGKRRRQRIQRPETRRQHDNGSR